MNFTELQFVFSAFSWRDALEVLFLSTVFYQCSRWLVLDQHKNLLGYFYSYAFVWLGAYAANLGLVASCLAICAPITAILFIVLHQKTLQKNFVTLRNYHTAVNPNTDWLELLVRAALVSINNNKEFLCVIEHTHALNELIHAPVNLYAPIKEDLLAIILESAVFESQSLVWVQSQGTLLGINAQWGHTQDQQAVATSPQNIPGWKQDALLITSSTDAVLFHIDPRSRSFTIIVQGTVVEGVSSNNALPFIKKYITNATPSTGDNHVNQAQKRRHAQRAP
jgi:hypothetical protein